MGLSKLGVIYALLHAACFSLNGLFARWLTDDIAKHNIPPFRSIIQAASLWPLLYCIEGAQKVEDQVLEILYVKKLWITVLGRAVGGYISFLLYFMTLDYISIGDATAIRALSGPVTAIFAYLILGEKITNKAKCLVFVGVIGMFFISRSKTDNLPGGSTTTKTLIGVGMGLVSVIFASLAMVAMRGMGKRVHYLIPSQVHAMVGVLFVIPAFLVVGLTPVGFFNEMNINDFWYLLGISVAGTLAQVFKKLALEYEKAAVATIFFNTQVIFTYAWQWGFLDNAPSWEAMVGAGLILSSAALFKFT